MAQQNVNTAAKETQESSTFNGQGIPGLSPELADSLAWLAALKSQRMLQEERAELIYGTLLNMVDQICNTVTDWSRPRPMLPIASFRAWIEASHIAHNQYGDLGEAAWGMASRQLATNLAAGYAMHVNDIA
ncbi:hypothetical protein ACQPT2_21210 [Erwinia amylovora]